jgi:hypothetical protein
MVLFGEHLDDELYQSVKVMFGFLHYVLHEAESCGSLAALTHLRLVVEYYVIIPNNTVLSHSLR